MVLTIDTAPAIEPVTLAETKEHCRIADSDLDPIQSIAPASYAIGTKNGTSVDVIGYSVVATLAAGTCGASGTVDAKLQESDDYSTWTDVTDGDFTQVTEANDNADYELVYSGSKRYVRAVGVVAVAACVFGMSIVKKGDTSVEDTLLNNLITAARNHVETVTRRALITQTWILYLDGWPSENEISIPLPTLQSVTSVKYKDTDGTEYTFSSSDYIVDIDTEPGRVVLEYGASWPSVTLYPSNPIYIEFVCGYGAARSNVPEALRLAIKMLVAHWYDNRELVAPVLLHEIPMGIDALMIPYRIWRF